VEVVEVDVLLEPAFVMVLLAVLVAAAHIIQEMELVGQETLHLQAHHKAIAVGMVTKLAMLLVVVVALALLVLLELHQPQEMVALEHQ
jgi:hypothetical protein